MIKGLTFYSKKPVRCPVCDTEFKREELLTGRGRLNAGPLTVELRRTYLPTKKYGKVYPLIYPVTVCPNCYFAAFKEDFEKLPDKEAQKAENFSKIRVQYINKLFGKIDFFETRDLKAGIASYILAISSYSFFPPKKFAPTPKQAISAIRAAWLLGDLYEETKDRKYEIVQEVFYEKALEFYELAIDRLGKGEELPDAIKHYGPDIDKNFGYEGMLYILSVLKYKFAYRLDPEERIKTLAEIKRVIARFVGIGKKSSSKPDDVINIARDLYEKISDEISKLAEELGVDPSQL